MKNEKLVEMCHITKNFPGVRALDDVDFDLCCGETHVLIGENGAGKSTLVKILAGVYPLETGSILINGEGKRFHNTSDAQKMGISIVFQECNLIPTLTVAQNILSTTRFLKLVHTWMWMEKSRLPANCWMN
jgi:ABC-type sugar transport system, ATPase component